MEGPVIISPRLLPGLAVGGGFLSVEPTDRTDRRGAPYWRYFVDVPALDGVERIEYEGEDLSGCGNAGDMLATLCAFLTHAVEEARYGSDDCDLFPSEVVDWAEWSFDDLGTLQIEIEESA